MSVAVTVDLRDEFGPVRDQGSRPTCLAFAASDAHAGLRFGWDPLSCEYVFYHAQRLTGRSPSKGAFLRDVLKVLKQRGQPLETGWPYLSVLPDDLSTYCPPLSIGGLFCRDSELQIETVDQIYAALDSGTPAIILTKLTKSFFLPPTIGVVDHVDGDLAFPAPRHALVAVGYGELNNERVVLIRNSWGTGWGLDGHIWLTESYLASHLYGLAILKEDSNVSSSSAAA